MQYPMSIAQKLNELHIAERSGKSRIRRVFMLLRIERELSAYDKATNTYFETEYEQEAAWLAFGKQVADHFKWTK